MDVARVVGRRWRLRPPRPRGEDGAATVEFIFLGVLIVVPMLYVTIAFFDIQRNGYAVTHAAREAGRAVATAPDLATGVTWARYAVKLAMRDQGLSDDEAELRFVGRDVECGAGGPTTPNPGAASLEPGATFAVCVRVDFTIPGVPTWFDGSRNTLTGRYLVRVDNFRSKRPQSPANPTPSTSPTPTPG